jgi:P-type Cu2+ transporter
MQTAVAISISHSTCAHCGLPITTASPQSDSGPIYCCHACRMVASIIGRRAQGEQSWNLLRLGFGALLAMNIMMISLLLYTGSAEPQAVPIFRRVLLGLSVPALAILIPPFLSGAARELVSKKMSLDSLIAVGSVSAFAVSAVNAVRGAGEIYFDTATMLPLLVTFGKIIEASAKIRAADLLQSLESLLPSSALLIKNARNEEVSISQLRPGNLIRVRPGERIAVDGKIVEGNSTIEEAAFSGEFLPRHCAPGDSVVAGTVNGTGALVVAAERTGQNLLLHRIIEMIHNAWRHPSQAQRLADRAANLFIPAVLSLAAGSLLSWCVLGDASQGLLSALSVLVVACPCTMGIATPLATSLAIARAGRAGIVVRGGTVMEHLGKCQMIFFDKTGTLTKGEPVVEKVVVIAADVAADELLGRLASLETASEHALGRAVIAKSSEGGIELGSVTGLEVTPGRGVSGVVTWRGITKEVLAGAPGFPVEDPNAPEVESDCTVIDVAWDGEVKGRLFLGDAARPEASGCVEELGRLGLSCALLSGDRFPAAAATAKNAGISDTYAPRTPDQKLEAVSSAVAAGRTVAMIGDGINDAPALAAAQIGMAMGAGMDLAKQAGNVVLLSGELMQIPWLIKLGRRTLGIVRGNFAWSFAYNTIALCAAAAGVLHPLLAAIAMVASSLTVLGNSLRIRSFPGCELSGDLRGGSGPNRSGV